MNTLSFQFIPEENVTERATTNRAAVHTAMMVRALLASEPLRRLFLGGLVGFVFRRVWESVTYKILVKVPYVNMTGKEQSTK